MMQDFEEGLNLGWIPIYEEISKKLLDKKYNSKPGRQRLVELLYNGFANRKLKHEPLMDQYPEGKRVRLDDICPFTMIMLLNRKVSYEDRNKLLDVYTEGFNLKKSSFRFVTNTNDRLTEKDKEWLPYSQSFSVWFFDYKYKRRPGDIDKVWTMFKEALDYADHNGKNKNKFVNAFYDCISVAEVGPVKLSQALYAVRPRHYPVLDKNVTKYLKQRADQDEVHQERILDIWGLTKKLKEEKGGEEYLKIADGLREEFKDEYGEKSVYVHLFKNAYLSGKDTKKVKSTTSGLPKELNLGWIPIYEEISQKLLKKRSKSERKTLVKMIYGFLDSNQELGLSRPQDQDPKGNKIDLDDICPFTVMNFLNRVMTSDKKDKILVHYLKSLKLKPTTFRFAKDNSKETIPLADSMNYWFFPYKFEREEGDIEKQWKMFQVALDYADGKRKNEKEFISAYDSSVKVQQVGPRKLSGVLYALRPRVFPTLDDKVCTYLYNLSKEGALKSEVLNDLFSKKTGRYDGSQYLMIANALIEEFSGKYGKKDVFVGLSYDAYRKKDPVPVPVPDPVPVPNNNSGKHPLNQILYGPPGTG